ncbi:hypothetical protein ACQJBY_061208 [Aegilops geniculata]
MYNLFVHFRGEHFKGSMDWRCKNAHTENSSAVKLGGFTKSLSRNKNKPVANGILGSKDRTYVVEGNMLEEQYVAVSVRGYVIACPCSHAD